MTGEELFKKYEAICFEHLGEPIDEMSPEVEYARFIYGLPNGFTCSKAFTYEEVYAKLEEAERTGKKLVLKDPRHLDSNYAINPSIEEDDDYDSSMVICLE